MKIEVGKKYKTRDGKKVRLYAVDCGGTYSVHGAITSGEVQCISCWKPCGKHNNYGDIDETGRNDLIEIKEDWEIAVDILANEASILIFNKSINYFSIVQSVSELYMTYGVSQEILVLTDPFKKWTMKKEDFRLATKEEVIEYFFGGKDEN